MITCLIVDDEQHAIDVLAYHVKQTPALKLVHTCNNPVEALEYLQNNPVQILFVDIQMPGITGIELVKAIQQTNTKVIFCTAYSEFALDGFELNASDYLVKPISFGRFKTAINKVTTLIENESAKNEIDKKDKNFFFIKAQNKGKLIKVDYSEIDYIESRRNYVAIFSNHKNNMILSTLKEMESKLPPDKFLRIHKSYIIALDKIKTKDINGVQLINYTGVLPIGEMYKAALKKAVNKKVL